VSTLFEATLARPTITTRTRPFECRRALPNAHGVFGTHRGLRLCDNLFAPLPQTCGSYHITQIELPVETNFEKKRCVDVAVVQGSAITGNRPVLFALFAASSNTNQSQYGATELRAYKIDPNTDTYPRFPNSNTIVTFPPPTNHLFHGDAAGSALAADPGDATKVYVGLGKGGIYQVQITSGPMLTASPLVAFTDPPMPSTPPWDNVRDIAVVQTVQTGNYTSRLYATLNYGGILERNLTTGANLVTCVYTLASGCGYVERIAAVTDGGTKVLVAVGLEKYSAVTSESGAPGRTTGIWSNICLHVGIADSQDPCSCTQLTAVNKIKFFQRDTATTAPFVEVVDTSNLPTNLAFGPVWGSLGLRKGSGSYYYCYACTAVNSTAVYQLLKPFSATQSTISLLAAYTDKGFPAWDGAVSTLNPNVVRFGFEGFSGDDPGDMLYIQPPIAPQVTPQLIPIPDTTSLCSSPPPPPNCPLGDPIILSSHNPFAGHLFGEAHWIDPDPQFPDVEWFMPGAKMALPVTVVHAPVNGYCTYPPFNECFGADPCTLSPPVYWSQLHDVGWQLVRLVMTGTPPSRNSMAMKWWQIQVPQDLGRENTETTEYIRSVADPRTDVDGVPLLVHTVRAKSNEGYKIFRPRDLMNFAAAACIFGDSPLPIPNGFGEQLRGVPVLHAVTHLELEGTCQINVSCSSPHDSISSLLNSRSESFELTDSQGNSYSITAVAAGSETATGLPVPTCLWGQNYYGRAMVVFYDVTETGASFQPPQLLKVALGPAPISTPDDYGLAWVVTTKTYGSGPDAKTYAFVGDLMGRLLVFDVSYDQLFPDATQPYIASLSGSEAIPNPFLLPVAVFNFPVDPYDGLRPNCPDLEVDGNYLYAALGRAGVGVLDVTTAAYATSPSLSNFTLVDTPGFTTGIMFRTDPTSQARQMIVGDVQCGVRLYQ
jgi:hypothetical protein